MTTPLSPGNSSRVAAPERPTQRTTSLLGRDPRYYLSGWRLGVIALVVAILFPFLASSTLQVTAISIGIYVLLALGLNIVVGYAGLLDLGYVAFFVIGSYTVAAFTYGSLQGPNGQQIAVPVLPFWPLVPLAAVLAGLFGVLLGAPTLRLRGDYLAIVTLGFGEIVPIVFQNIPYFYGQLGIQAQPPGNIGPVSFMTAVSPVGFYFLTLVLVVIVVLAVLALRDSSIGRAWIAIREDETSAETSGVNLVRTKLLAFGLGACVGGIGGALNAGFLLQVAPSNFSFGISITILAMIVLGGIGSIPGVIVGAIILRFVDVYLLGQLNNIVQGSPLFGTGTPLHFLASFDFNAAKFTIYGLVLMGIILLRPQGLIPNTRRKRELKGEGAAPESMSAAGMLALEEAGGGVVTEAEDSFTGAGSDAQGRED